METGLRIFAFGAILATLACPPDRATGADLAAELRDFAVRTWTKADGLPNSSVTVILQAHDGYLWIGTGAGLVRFDGARFTAIPLLKQGAGATVAVTSLCEDANGCLWIGSQEQGVFCRQNGRVKHFGPADGLLDPSVTSLTLDNEARVWIGTRRGVNRWDGRRFAAFTTGNGLPDNSVLSVHAARSGTVWITTAGGISRFIDGHLTRFHLPTNGQERDQELLEAYEDHRGNLWAFCATYLINLAEGKRINYFPGEKSAVTRIWSLCEGRGGRLWIGASGRGVFCFDGAKFQPVTLNEGRWPNDVRTICEDHEGNLWLGISGVGLVQLRAQNIALLSDSEGLPPGAATCLILDALGHLCVGMDSGGVYVSVGDRFEELSNQTRLLSQNLPSALCAGPDGCLWIATTGAGLCQVKDGRTALFTTANGLSDDCVFALCADGAGNVWAGTRSGALHRLANGHIATFTKSDGLPGTAITALLAAREGGLWVGTAGGVLMRGDSNFQNATVASLSPKLRGKAILALCESTNHGLWIGTDGGGFACLDQHRCRAWNSQDGLPDNVVSGMVEDGDGNLWLVMPKGLCRIASDSVGRALTQPAPLKEKMVFETDPGPPRVSRFGGPRSWRSPGGRLWFALTSGLLGVDVHRGEADKPPPHVHIEAMLVNNEPAPLLTPQQADAAKDARPPPLTLSASLRTLEFQFTALSFDAPEKVRFRHKLDGFDTDWVDSGSERHTRYGPLPSGSYEFHVTACNADDVWNDKGASLAFIVPTPLWRAPWVLGLCGLTATALGAGTVRLVSHRRLRRRLAGLEQQQAMERERMRIAQNMHDEIGSKLTKISFLSERAKVELRGAGKAEGKIDSIASTSRELLKALDEIVWAVNPRNDTLEHLAAYLCQYAREYFQDTSVECDLHVQSQLPQVDMSAEIRHNLFLAFEESLSNVLKHAAASCLRAEIGTHQDRLLIIIRDNGRGFEQVPHTESHLADSPAATVAGGNGLHNMRQRLADVGGQCSIQSVPGQGTSVSLSVALNPVKMPG
jgi:ligand-binding sensor domain-containing protein/signal transduction histidine kinase